MSAGLPQVIVGVTRAETRLYAIVTSRRIGVESTLNVVSVARYWMYCERPLIAPDCGTVVNPVQPLPAVSDVGGVGLSPCRSRMTRVPGRTWPDPDTPTQSSAAPAPA